MSRVWRRRPGTATRLIAGRGSGIGGSVTRWVWQRNSKAVGRQRRGFCGIYMPSRYGNMAQCAGLALATERIRSGTAIAPIYAQTTEEFASGAAYIHEGRL